MVLASLRSIIADAEAAKQMEQWPIPLAGRRIVVPALNFISSARMQVSDAGSPELESERSCPSKLFSSTSCRSCG
jgi:hypothetical protein